MAAKKKLSWRRDDDHNMGVIGLDIDGKQVGSISLTGAQLENFIAALSELRMSLDGAPDLNEPPREIKVVNNPNWLIEKATDGDGMALVVSHPVFGWQGYLFNQNTCNEIAEIMRGTRGRTIISGTIGGA